MLIIFIPQVSQMALIHSPPEMCQSKLEITIFILVGCLGYSNSAMNPILYAFLSDNFKKSFMKAFTCAKSNEVNAQLHAENSFFPRFGRGKHSDCISSNKTTNIIINNTHVKTTTKLVPPPARFGNNTIESTVDVTENGSKNGHSTQIVSTASNINNIHKFHDDESDDEERELQNQHAENPICIINPSNGTSKPPVLHTDL